MKKNRGGGVKHIMKKNRSSGEITSKQKAQRRGRKRLLV